MGQSNKNKATETAREVSTPIAEAPVDIPASDFLNTSGGNIKFTLNGVDFSVNGNSVVRIPDILHSFISSQLPLAQMPK